MPKETNQANDPFSVVPNYVAEVAKTLGRISENAQLWRVRLPVNGRIWGDLTQPAAGGMLLAWPERAGDASALQTVR